MPFVIDSRVVDLRREFHLSVRSCVLRQIRQTRGIDVIG